MKRRVAAITTLVFVLSSVPYLAGHWFAGADVRFTWIVFDVTDTAQYYAWMRSFSQDILIANPLTPEAGSNRFFNLQWWLLGHLGFSTPLGATVTYQLLRVIALAAFAASLFWFCRIVIPGRALFAFTLIMFASGLGWILVVLKQWTGELRYPLDVQIAEANTFFSAMAFPHLLVAAALLLTVYCLYLRAESDRRWKYALLAGVTTFALGFSHGYDLIPAMAIPIATTGVLALRSRKLPGRAVVAAAIILGAGPPALYALALTELDATWSGVISQYGNAGVYSPTPPHLVILLGIPFLLALPQLRPSRWAGLTTPGIFLRVWLIVGFFLLYIPTDYQVKMLIGYQIPAVILMVETLLEVQSYISSRGRIAPQILRVAPIAILLVIALTNIYLTAWRVVELRRQDYPYYLTVGDVAVLESLPQHVGEGDVVLSSPDVGIFVPVYSDARPFLAHWAQTLNFHDRRDLATYFYDSTTADGERHEVLTNEGITFVIYGPAEARLAGSESSVGFALAKVISGDTILYRTPTSGRR